MQRLLPTWALLDELPVRPGALVSLERVLRQRRVVIDVGSVALRHMALDELLEHAVECAADGVGSEMAKIAALQADGTLLIIAGRNLKPGVAGSARLAADASNPAGECLSQRRIVNIPDLRDRTDYRLPELYPEHAVISTVNIPIMLDSGPFGVLEIDGREAHDFDELDLSFLIGIAGVVGEGVARVRREAALTSELSAREILLREHHHRVRNQYQVLSAVLHTQAQNAGTSEARERFFAVERRVFALSSLYDHLLGADHAGTVVLQDYMASLCDSLREFYAVDERGISVVFRRTGDIHVAIDIASTLGLIVNELVANGVEHAFGESGGEITICIERDPSGGTNLFVSDNGVGYSHSDDGVGMTTVRRLLARLGGAIEVSDTAGTKWTIRVPPTVLYPDPAP